MGTTAGDTSTHLKRQLLDEGQRFSFIQAYRLLRYFVARDKGSLLDENELIGRIRARPDLSLAFPESDVVAIDEYPLPNDETGYSITATFLGLYGASSPLPTFYTEDLFEEEHEERTAMRDFLDVLNAPLFALFFKIWGAYRLIYRIAESGDQSTIEQLRSLAGISLAPAETRPSEPDSLLRYIGHLTSMPRSAEGLRGLLADRFRDVTVNVTQCVTQTARLPEQQRFMLGVRNIRLGEDTYLGSEIFDRMGSFTVSLGPLNGSALHGLFPDGRDFARINELIGFYIDQPLTWNIELIVNTRTIKCAQLGGNRWSRLGWNTWVFSENNLPDQTSITYPGRV